MHKIKKLICICLVLAVFPKIIKAQKNSPVHAINMVFTSDAHYGILRDKFRGDTMVAGNAVNKAMVAQMRRLVDEQLPADKGVAAGQEVTAVDYLIETGDIANRQEPPYQSAANSWQQFIANYGNTGLKGQNHQPTKLLIVPGNHDISNAIGFTKKMVPATDPTVMVEIYNRMLKPATPLNNKAFDYAKHKINYSKDIGGIHFMFITLWPDSAERIWMARDLKKVSAKTPVIIFTHDQPTCEAKHFSNPKAPGKFTQGNKFENLVTEVYKEGPEPLKDEQATDKEQRGWVSFLKQHPNIKAYFHGNSNWNEFYDYKGPDNDVNLPVFRVDSPMKGKYSAKDETKLSFQLISLDPINKRLTVRECLWNTKPGNAKQAVIFGESRTISLKVL
jgi:hypothetical protein